MSRKAIQAEGIEKAKGLQGMNTPWQDRVFHEVTGEKQSGNKYPGNDPHRGEIQLLAWADDLLQRIGPKVMIGKNIAIIQGGIINENRN